MKIKLSAVAVSLLLAVAGAFVWFVGARNPYTPPKRPAYPDRRGFGIKPEDK